MSLAEWTHCEGKRLFEMLSLMRLLRSWWEDAFMLTQHLASAASIRSPLHATSPTDSKQSLKYRQLRTLNSNEPHEPLALKEQR
jgi:hypothetical protein